LNVWISIKSDFEEKPISSASIAQVHRARLKTGEKVAVKVQHEWLKEESIIDLHMTQFYLQMGKALFKDFNYDFLAEDLKYNLPQELNFKIEAFNGNKMSRLFKDDPRVKIPTVYSEFSNEKVLVMEFVEGINIDKKEEMLRQGIDVKEVARMLSDCFSRQIYEFGVTRV
jgi:predicted unusual protein kinase regulating ubiquinone biosynthesis (AarF/ABC1/UbiB family)